MVFDACILIPLQPSKPNKQMSESLCKRMRYNFIEKTTIDYCIYGHHYNNTPDFTIGKTRMLTSQLVYVQYGELHLFDNTNTIIL